MRELTDQEIIRREKAEKLKELGAVNVLIIGDEVRASFSDRVSYVYNIMK